MATISLVMIVKNEEKVLERAIESVKSIVDEFIICDTGSTDNTKNIIKKYGELIEIPFEDYVVTKNNALSFATSDYILMLDADEYVMEGLDKLKQYAESGYEVVTASIIEGSEEVTTCQYDRNRMWKNNNKWKFEGPGVHEVICGPGENNKIDRGIKVRHDHTHRAGQEEAISKKFLMYVDILNKAIEKNPNDYRAWFYLGRTYADLNYPLKAIESFQIYLDLPNNFFMDERWQAQIDIAKCYKQQGEYSKAIDSGEKAIKIDPRRAEAFNFMGLLYFILQDWYKAIEYYEKAIELPIPDNVSLFLNPREYYEVPADNLALCYNHIRQFDKAEELTIELIGKEIHPRLATNLWWYRKETQQKIFFALGKTPEPVFGGILDQQGVHGVETTYIELADELSALGHTVFLFCSCDNEHVYNNVYYVPESDISKYMDLEPDVIIASRWFEALTLDSKSKKIIWFQDAYFAEPSVKNVFEIADAVICSSPWHRSYIAERYGHIIKADKLKIIPLGIRKKLFINSIERDPNKIIYSSNPNRGLYILLDMWGNIVEKFPNVNLSIYYGWEGLKTWANSNEWNQKISDEMNAAMEKIKTFNNVEFKGRLTKKELANEFMSSTLCLYPNNFYETFCLTALETQAAGVPMVATDQGALSTTLNRKCNFLISGDPFSSIYKSKFLDKTLDLLGNSAKLNEYSNGCSEFVKNGKFDWVDIAKNWQVMLFNIEK